MENFENEAIEKHNVKPRLQVRYVDYVFCLWEESECKLLKFKDYLNQQYKTIKFTLAFENGKKIAVFGQLNSP